MDFEGYCQRRIGSGVLVHRAVQCDCYTPMSIFPLNPLVGYWNESEKGHAFI